MATDVALLAEDPDFYTGVPEGSRRIVDDRFCVTVASDHRWAGVCRLRLPEDDAGFAEALSEISALAGSAKSLTWNVGPSSLPPQLPERLRAAGLRDPDPPLDPVVAAMVLTTEPPAVVGIEVRRIETFEEHLAGLEIVLSGNWTEEAAEDERRIARRTYERRRRRGASEWLAIHNGKPVAHALAIPSPVGLYLAGGSTLPEARGRGCYRALVRARWDEAIRLGLPGLAVQAQYGLSAPILRRLGFQETGVIHTLQSPRGDV